MMYSLVCPLKRQYSSNDCVHVCLFISMTQYPISNIATLCPSNIRLWEPKTSVSSTCNENSDFRIVFSDKPLLFHRLLFISNLTFPDRPFVQNSNHVLDINYTCNMMCLVEANLTVFVLVTLCVHALMCRCMCVAKSELNSFAVSLMMKHSLHGTLFLLQEGDMKVYPVVWSGRESADHGFSDTVPQMYQGNEN